MAGSSPARQKATEVPRFPRFPRFLTLRVRNSKPKGVSCENLFPCNRGIGIVAFAAWRSLPTKRSQLENGKTGSHSSHGRSAYRFDRVLEDNARFQVLLAHQQGSTG